jgi:NADH-quinone oxidoreductase subunit M
MFHDLPILSLVIWMPILGGVLVLALGDRFSRQLSLLASVLTFVFSIPLYTGFDSSTYKMQFQENADWIASFHVRYHLGVDGISMPLILLTTFVTVLVVIAGWEVIKQRRAQYFARRC